MYKDRVLIVDDSAEMRQTLCDLVLKPGGYEVLEATDGTEGLQMIIEHRPDLVIMDERMPGMRGVQVLEALEERQVRVPVIFITSHGSEELVVQAFRLGVRDYVIKPFAPHDMQQVVEKVLEEKHLRAERDGLIQELRTLFAIGRSVASKLDLEAVLNRVVEAAVFLTKAEEGLLLLVEEETGDLVLRTAVNIDERVAHSMRVRVKDSLAEQVRQSGEPVILSGEPHQVATGYLVKALVYLPIRTPERGIIGVLGITNRLTGQSFSNHQVQLLSALGNFAGVAVANAQLYERAEAERHKLAAVLREAAEAVIVMDPEMRIILSNPTANQMLGLTPGAVGKPASAAIMHPPLQELFRAQKLDQPLRTEVTVNDGRTFNAQLSPVTGVGYALMMQDITHLKEMDRIKSEFVQNVSHELRAPLSLIRGYADLLTSGELGELAPQQQQPMEIIARRTRMLNELLENISLILEPEIRPIEREPVSLAALSRAAVEDFYISADQAGITLKINIPSDLPPVSGDTTCLRRVLDNLISNAIKFTPSGGTVTIQAEQHEQQIILQVTDTGIGIPPEQQVRIFDRFYQVDGKEYGGMGLGLALVKELVESLGGEVRVDSRLNQGSVFSVAMPVYSPQP